MRFVQCGLALDTGNDCTAFLLEEHIDSTAANGSWFVKYVNNSSAKPCVFSNKEKAYQAEFLSFAQHVQFWKTNGLAFVSDFQGMTGHCHCHFLYLCFRRRSNAFDRSTNYHTSVSLLLPDSMMWIAYIRYRKLGITLFNEGNTNFESFFMEHECNRFCQFYQLPLLQTIVKKVLDDEEGTHSKSYRPPPPVPTPPSDDDLPETPFIYCKKTTKGMEGQAEVVQ